jgi:hypothetical protein
MKKFILFVIGVALAGTLYTSCKKNSSTTGNSGLTLSNLSVKRGERLIATAAEPSGNSVIKWSVSPPSANTFISSSGNKSVLLFSIAGSYTITANYYTDSSANVPYGVNTSTVTVTDSIYNDSSAQWVHCDAIEQVPVNSNDQISLMPVSYSDTGLVLIAHTQQTYGSNYPLLNYLPGPDSVAGYEFVFGAVYKYPCSAPAGADLPATAIISFGNLSMGTSDVTFILNGTLYKGSLVVTPSSCTFNWSYTSGVVISPLTIHKQ